MMFDSIPQLTTKLSAAGFAGVSFVPGDPGKVAGDLAAPVFEAAKSLGQQPLELARQIAGFINDQPGLADILTAEAAAPGFVNLSYKPAYLLEVANQVMKLEFGTPISQLPVKPATYLIEYSQPNIAKPMHFGHLRTTMLGESIKRLLLSCGERAIGINHLGDWGSQFGKLLVAYKRWGSPAELKTGGIREMLRLYVKFHEELKTEPDLAAQGAAEFALLEQGDQENHALWQQMRDVSLVEFRKVYARLGIKMDELEMGESDYVPALRDLINNAVTAGIAVESEGALVIPVGEDLPPCLIRKSDGATLYATRDLAAIAYRIKRWSPDQIMYVVAGDQSLHFQQVFRAAVKLGLVEPEQLVHIPYGLVSLPEGKMSTRAGRVIFLEDVLDEAVNRARLLLTEKSPHVTPAEIDTIAELVGVGAVKYQILNSNRLTTIVFDLEQMVSLQGNTGPYLQYAHARARSILAKAGNWEPPTATIEALDPLERAVFVRLTHLPNVIHLAGRTGSPNRLSEWLHSLATEFNHFYETQRILQASEPDRSRRLLLAAATASALRYGLDLLAIETPDKL